MVRGGVGDEVGGAATHQLGGTKRASSWRRVGAPLGRAKGGLGVLALGKGVWRLARKACASGQAARCAPRWERMRSLRGFCAR